MSKLLLVIGALVVGSLILPAAFWIGSFVLPPIRPAPSVEWLWSKEKASPEHCVKQHLAGEKVSNAVLDRIDGRVFTRWEGKLFVAKYARGVTGCEVAAIDLSTGRQYWKSRLEAIGDQTHSEYYNSVNIETDGEKVIIYGNESHGRYVEHLDINTGKMLLNKKFDR